MKLSNKQQELCALFNCQLYTPTSSAFHYCMKQYSIPRKSIHTESTYSDASIYSMKPPSRATSNLQVPSLTRMSSPPPSLRPLLERLNRTPSRARRTAPYIKTEPVETPSIRSSDAEHIAMVSHRALTSQSNNDEGSAPSSTSTMASEGSALSQALINMLNTPSTSNAAPALDFRGCRVEIHFHVHPSIRPAFPPCYSRVERLKRKRESHDIDQVTEGEEVLERQVKKIKLGNDSEIGLKIKGQAMAGKRSERMTAADGVKTRSRIGSRRMSSRGVEAGRGRY
jgi:hypothetical protein